MQAAGTSNELTGYSGTVLRVARFHLDQVGTGEIRLELVRAGWCWLDQVGTGQSKFFLVRLGWNWLEQVGAG